METIPYRWISGLLPEPPTTPRRLVETARKLTGVKDTHGRWCGNLDSDDAGV